MNALIRLFLFMLACNLFASTGSHGAVYDFNPAWKLHVGDAAGANAADYDDSTWMPVTLPHAWNEDEAFRKDIAEMSTGVAWYRKNFVLPPEARNGKVFLEFEGIRQAGEVYVNGRSVGRHENGVMAFGLDLTEFVHAAPATNVIAVRTDNAWDYREKATNSRFQWADRNFNANYGGIPKNVRLHVRPKLHQTLPLYSNLGTLGVYVHATDIDVAGRAATVTVESEVRNEELSERTFSLQVSIADPVGRIIKTFATRPMAIAPGATTTAKAAARIDGLNFWSWGYGYLYDVTTSLLVDGKPTDPVTTRTGFRKTEFARGMVLLNGRAIQMHGYAQRTSNEWPALGLSVPPWLSDYSNRLMVESGGNLVRWMHVTPWKQDVESCDRVGLIQAMPAGDSEKDAVGRWWEQRVELMRDAIIYNRNNPSILFFECGNNQISEAHMAEMKALRDRYDPHGGRAIGSRNMLGSEIAEYGGEMLYINKSARQPFWAMEYCRDEALRRYWDDFSPPFHKDGAGPKHRDQDASIYNRNQDTFAIENVIRWHDYWRERPGTGKRVSSGGVNIIFSDTNTHHRGAENYRRSGEVDPMRIPKDSYFAHQVMWDGWVDVERPRVHLIGHWNYTGGTTKDIHAVSSADRVELFLNGKSLGHGMQSNRFLFTFNSISWHPGTLTAIGYDARGAKVCAAELQTAGAPSAIRLTNVARPQSLRADGADVALVEVEVVDGEGRRCPTAFNEIEFRLSGPAEWRGGIAQGSDNHILSRMLPVECGVNRVLLRSRTEAGRITLTATSAGLKPAIITLESTSVVVEHGIGRELPGAELPANLSRGPTPSNPSYTVSREAVVPVRTTAGANAEKATLSCDDNELTAWVNDNHLPTGWIDYEFAQAVTIDEVTLKLTGWRQRSYPLRITVDGEEVFRGSSPRSLGYCTLDLKPVKGRVLKIELVDASADKDAFKGVTELGSAKENASTGADKIRNGTLSIIEAEFYSRL